MLQEGAQTALAVDLPEGVQVIPYCGKMLETNAVPGLLPLRHQMVDGAVRLRYSVAGKVPLGEYLRQNPLPLSSGRLFLTDLTHSLLHLEDYFLSVDQCLLDPERVYVGDGLHAFLPCVPVQCAAEAVPGTRLRGFYEKLLSMYFAVPGSSDYDEMFKWVYSAPSFDLPTFSARFLRDAAPQSAPQPAPRPAAAPAPAAVPRPAPAAPAAPHFAPPIAAPAAQPQLDAQPQDAPMQIPGGGAFAMPPAPPEKKPARAQKAARPEKNKEKAPKSFGLHLPFGRRREETPAAQPAVPVRPLDAAPSAPAAAERSAAAAPDAAYEGGTILVQPCGETSLAMGAGAGGAWLLHRGQRVAITRAPFALGKRSEDSAPDYAIEGNNKVSRRHASILSDGGGYQLQVDGSLNGTFLNGQRLAPKQPQPLADGDEIRLFDEILTFHQDHR